MAKQNKLVTTNKNKEYKLLTKAISAYIVLDKQIKHFEEAKKNLKEILKQYNFEEIVITNNNSLIEFKVSQYLTTRRSLNEKKLVEALGEDMIAPFRETKQIKNIKFSYKVK